MITFMSILFMFILANIPFINNRLFGLFLTKNKEKSSIVRIIEFFFLYLMIHFLFFFIEIIVWHCFKKSIQLYLVTMNLFFMFSFPGLIYHYFFKKNNS